MRLRNVEVNGDQILLLESEVHEVDEGQHVDFVARVFASHALEWSTKEIFSAQIYH